jgi:pimeloyl-[acyl-carrier protein] synthase
LDVNFYERDFVADPYPHLEAIRAQGRVVRNDLLGLWMVPGYRDTLDIKHRPEDFTMTVYADKESTPFLGGSATMITSDPPEHERLRSPVVRAFLRSSVERLEPRIAELVETLLQDALEKADPDQGIDLLASLAQPLPTIVIAEMLGVSPADRADFNRWSDDIVALAAGIRASDVAERFRRADDSGVEMRAYFRQAIADHRQNPRDDLIGALLVSNDKGTMTDGELIAACVLLLAAGNETTTKLIANCTALLAQHPAERERLLDDPGLVSSAIEEALRFEGISQGAQRRIVHDVEFAGEMLRAGEIVTTLTGAANRDPEIFNDPQRFDVGRSPNPQIGFGHGIHHCLGAPLARLEGRIAITRLLARVSHFEVSDLDYGTNFNVRGPERLTFHPDPAYLPTGSN